MTALAFSPLRRGACPGLSAPMPTGDGLLARLLPTGTITVGAFRALCAAARRHGNGVIEITTRGSAQIRGLSPTSAPLFAEAIAELAITASDGIPVLRNPLAGLDPEELLDTGAIVARLRDALTNTSLLARLAPKVSVTVDGGGALNLDALAADVRLRAARTGGKVVFRIGVAGDQTNAIALGAVAPERAADAALRLLDVVARSGCAARARDVIAAHGGVGFRAAIGDLLIAGPASASVVNEPRDPIGTHSLRDGAFACGVGLAFGHASAGSLEELTRAAATHGAAGIRAAPGRTLLIVGLTEQAAASLRAAAERLSFVVRADDPRRYVFACAGAPICSSAYIPARAMAPSIAEIAAARVGPGFDIHISGCAKGCAHSKQTALTIVGTDAGYALVAGGRACDVPFATVPTDALPTAIARYAHARQCEDGQESCQENDQENGQERNHV